MDLLHVRCKISGTTVIYASYMLGFTLSWQVWQCSCHLRQNLHVLLGEPRLFRTAQHKKLLHLQHMQQALIDLTTDLCRTFNHILTFFLLFKSWHCLICGYFVIRINSENVRSVFSFRFHSLLPVLWINSIFIIYWLGSFAEDLGGTLQETIYTLRQSFPQDQFIERNVSNIFKSR